MAKPNEELGFVRKADLAIADLSAGGYLQPEQMKKFIEIAIEETVASAAVYVTTVNSPVTEIDKMTTMGRVLWPGVESQALGQAQRSKPGFDKVTITTKEAVAEVHIPRGVLEDQIERGVFQSTVTGYMARHVRKDIEDLLINGDVDAGADAWLQYISGMLKKASSYVIPAGSVTLTKGLLRDMMTTMPEVFSNQKGLVFWTNRKARSDYKSSVSDRGTILGDAIITGKAGAIGYDDVEVVKIPLFPNGLAPSGNKTNVLLHDPQNTILAFQRQMTLDTEYRPSQRVYAIIMTLRLDVQYQHEPMVVKATQVVGA